MVIYFIVLLFVSLFVFLHTNRKKNNGIDFFLFMAFLILVLFAGFRSASVGTDSGGYSRGFTRFNLSFSEIFTDSSSTELGYQALSILAKLFSDSYWAMFTVIAFVVVLCYLRVINKISLMPALSVFILITMGYYTFFFNGARQGLAAAIYSLSFIYLIREDFKKYALVVLIAFLFHKTAIIALPLYLLFQRKFSLKYLLLISIGSAIAITYFGSFLSMGTIISDKYKVYQSMEASGGEMFTLFYALISIFFILIRKYIPTTELKIYDIFLNMLIFSSVVFIVVTFAGGYVELTRTAFYFQLSTIFLWPYFFKYALKDKSTVAIFALPVLAIHLVYFYILLGKIGSLTPYIFNPEILTP